MDLTLPLDFAAIQSILPHRYPFLLVDRITQFEVDKRIVGIKNVSLNERYLSPAPDGRLALPPTICCGWATDRPAGAKAAVVIAPQALRSSTALISRMFWISTADKMSCRDVVQPRVPNTCCAALVPKQ